MLRRILVQAEKTFKKIGLCIPEVTTGLWCEKVLSWCQKQRIKISVPHPRAKCTVPPKCSQNQFSANISQSMRPREKIVEAENVLRKISYRIGYSRVSLQRPISLKIHSNRYKSRFLPFFHVPSDFFANISQSMIPI